VFNDDIASPLGYGNCDGTSGALGSSGGSNKAKRVVLQILSIIFMVYIASVIFSWKIGDEVVEDEQLTANPSDEL
jgi:hypothetical protein